MTVQPAGIQTSVLQTSVQNTLNISDADSKNKVKTNCEILNKTTEQTALASIQNSNLKNSQPSNVLPQTKSILRWTQEIQVMEQLLESHPKQSSLLNRI